MSWTGNDFDEPPPKPSRTPLADSVLPFSYEKERKEEAAPTMTYIVAENPSVLAVLMKENEMRGVNASSYNTPASVFNILAVEFGQTTENKPADEIPLKTCSIPAMELIPLRQNKSVEVFEKCSLPRIMSNEASVASGLNISPNSSQQQKDSQSRSLERNINRSAVTYFGRINSLERRQQDLNNESKYHRSQSLIRQQSGGLYDMHNNIRTASLERNQQYYANNFERFHSPPQPPPYVRPNNIGCLEKNHTMAMNEFMRKYCDQKAAEAQKPCNGGSLERNMHYQQSMHKQQIQTQLQHNQDMEDQTELPDENIYDFGGVHVKSCATIALKKSIERGMLPLNYEANVTSVQPPLQSNLKQLNTSPGIASRLLIFQGHHTLKQQDQQDDKNIQEHSSPNHGAISKYSEDKKTFQVLPQIYPTFFFHLHLLSLFSVVFDL